MEGRAFSLGDLGGSGFPLVEHAPDAMVIVDAAGIIRLVNVQTERLFGYFREELVGQPIEMLIPPRYHAEHVGHRSAYHADSRVRLMGADLELYALRNDGGEFPVEVSLSPVTTTEGTFVAAAIRDVSERKAFERRLRELNAELAEASEAKDRFFAAMSHELRTPLNAIIGFTGTLLMRLPGPITEEQERQLKIIQWSSRHLLSLINDILDLEKIQLGKTKLSFETVPVEEVVHDVVASLHEFAAEKNLALTAFVSPGAELLVTDRRSLRQIVLNLANNAIKYTEKGSVQIDVRATTWKGGPAVTLSVTDTGVGIKPEDQARLFGAFEQLDASPRNFEGSGLGLYLCRNLALLLEGELSFSSTPGKGSRFALTLPQRSREAALPDAEVR